MFIPTLQSYASFGHGNCFVFVFVFSSMLVSLLLSYAHKHLEPKPYYIFVVQTFQQFHRDANYIPAFPDLFPHVLWLRSETAFVPLQ